MVREGIAMKLVNLTCPNCTGLLKKEGNNLICQSCGAAFAVDYDESDVEHEKLETEEEREARRLQHEKELLAEKHRLMEESRIAAEKREQSRRTKSYISKWIRGKVSGLIALAIIALICFGCYKFARRLMTDPELAEQYGVEIPTTATTVVYDVSPDRISDELLGEFIEQGKSSIQNRRQIEFYDYTTGWTDYDVAQVTFDSAYLVTDIQNRGEYDADSRLVLIYQVVWHSEQAEDVTIYDCVYFNDLQATETSVISSFRSNFGDFNETMWQSVGYQNRADSYRINVTSLSGQVTELRNDFAEQ
jgi:uncharacterized Zn finger protein (UPF0148 family)